MTEDEDNCAVRGRVTQSTRFDAIVPPAEEQEEDALVL